MGISSLEMLPGSGHAFIGSQVHFKMTMKRMTLVLLLALMTAAVADSSIASAQLAAAYLTTPRPMMRPNNHRVSFAAGHSVAQPHFHHEDIEYQPKYPSYRPSFYPKPYFLKRPSYYKTHMHSDFLDFPVSSHKNEGSIYSFLFPLALLGISIPALGLMYTYFSRRRRRDLNSQAPDLEYYLQLLQNSLERFQELDD